MSWRENDASRATSRVAPPTSMYSMNRTSASTTAAVFDQVHELVVVDAADDDRVDLECVPKTRCAAAMPFLDASELVEARERREAIGVQRVEADGDAAQAGGGERVDLVGEQDAVCREREVVEPRLRGEHADERRKVAAQERLAAGQAQRSTPSARKTSTSALISSKCRTSSRGSHVYSSSGMQYCAAEVAPVGDRQPEVAERAAERSAARLRL